MTPYFSIDIETTGLDRDRHQVLEIGVVYETWDRPVEELLNLRILVKHEEIVGSPHALALNHKLLKEIAEGNYRRSPAAAILTLNSWVSQKHSTFNFDAPVILGGKNFAAFDLQFLKRMPGWDDFVKDNKVSHRYVDPGTQFWNPMVDKDIPNLAECLRRCGIEKETAHTAIEDAQDVIRVVRYGAGYNNWNE